MVRFRRLKKAARRSYKEYPLGSSYMSPAIRSLLSARHNKTNPAGKLLKSSKGLGPDDLFMNWGRRRASHLKSLIRRPCEGVSGELQGNVEEKYAHTPLHHKRGTDGGRPEVMQPAVVVKEVEVISLEQLRQLDK